MRLSACLIVKNEPRLERAVASIRPYVDEVVIVDTGSTDGTAEVAARLADRFESFTECNFDDGEIADFSAARNRSFELASYDTVVWLDADDRTIDGIEHLRDAIAWAHAEAKGVPWRAVFPYEYDHDADGRCILLQARERVVHPKQAFAWRYRVHEGLTGKEPIGWVTLEPPRTIVWKHDLDRRKPRAARNLRILRDQVERMGAENVDAKTAFDIGCELAKSGDHNRAIGWLARFYGSSDLDDERVLACLQAVDLLSFWPGQEQNAEMWAHRAIDLRPGWAEGYWAIARICYAAAGRDAANERRYLERAARFARKGLAQPATKTRVATNPIDRAGGIHALLFDVETRLGHHNEALESARACLAAQPTDPTAALHVREAERRAMRAKTDGADVVIICGITVEAWDPATAAARGIGGSETAVIEMGKRLVALGCRVRVYCRCHTAGVYDGVEYRPMNESDQAAGCDLLIAWRNATLFETVPAKVKWLWVHDTEPFGASEWNLALADRVLALSQWHAAHLVQQYPSLAGKVTVTRNGIDLARFAEPMPRKTHCAMWSSSPDRGLEQLLAMWPAIRARVPDAELHVFYGFVAFGNEYRQKLLAKMAKTDGVVVRDRVDQKTLAREMLAAGAWLYPSWAHGREFHETSCISAMEAAAAGLRIVTSRWGALPETARYGVLIDGDADTDEYQSRFVEAAVVALTQDGSLWRPVLQEHARLHFGWDGVASEWQRMIVADVASARPVVEARRDDRPVIDMLLAPQASGNVVMDAAGDPGSEAHGGGSRVGFLGLVRAMGQLSRYRVRAFSTFKDAAVERDGVEYIRLDRLTGYAPPDVAFAFYDTSVLSHYGAGVLRIGSHHTYAPYMHFVHADVNTAPSQHALEYLRDRFEPDAEWHVLPNAVGEMAVERCPVPGQVIYHTSPDRGLHILLRAYPIIKQAAPHASLRIVGPVQGILEGVVPKGRDGARMMAIRDAYAVAQVAGGVTLLGRLPRARLWRELGEASVFAFPCAPVAPCETFSVSLMECCKIGLPVVLAPADALESIYAGHVRMATHEPEAFAEAVVDVLTSEREQSRLAAAGKDLARSFTFERSAAALDAIIRAHRPGIRAMVPATASRARCEGEVLSEYV